ncbi:hypothetical protein BM1_00839 [Bipolaris maydis]|nr:hypothetical protein BM1_00839 [Bipolaris maydis]
MSLFAVYSSIILGFTVYRLAETEATIASQAAKTSPGFRLNGMSIDIQCNHQFIASLSGL